MRLIIKIVPALLLGFFLLQCAGSQSTQPANGRNSHHSIDFPEYRLGSGDEVEIKFFKNERFTRTQVIRPDGRITLERVGDILAAGSTPTQLDEVITKAYSAFVIDPEVTVFVTAFGSQKVFVLGEVQEPGMYDVTGQMSYLQAIAAAGGPNELAKLSSVMLIRKNSSGTEQAFKLNLRPGSQQKLIQKHGYVTSRDMLYIPATALGSANKFMRQIYGTILPPIDVYLRALLWQ